MVVFILNMQKTQRPGGSFNHHPIKNIRLRSPKMNSQGSFEVLLAPIFWDVSGNLCRLCSVISSSQMTALIIGYYGDTRHALKKFKCCSVFCLTSCPLFRVIMYCGVMLINYSHPNPPHSSHYEQMTRVSTLLSAELHY